MGDCVSRILNMLIALDCFVLSVCTLGKAFPGETISSAAFRAELHMQWFGCVRPVIDWLFSPFEDQHCFKAWMYARDKYNLPEDMR